MVATEPPNNIDGVSETATGIRPVRIFVALRISPDIALALAQYGRDLEQFSVRPVAPADIHLTLVPPWNEVSPAEAVEKLRRVVDRFFPFTLTFRHVGYGPEPKRPRFLWAECVASKEIAEFRVALSQAFGQADERPFRPHVTLARLRDKGRALARKHPLDQDLALTQRIESIELMQSPPPDGSGYKILASVPLAVSL
jgi:RNA 2',3'-cyclic 3'-phosphodiesterase